MTNFNSGRLVTSLTIWTDLAVLGLDWALSNNREKGVTLDNCLSYFGEEVHPRIQTVFIHPHTQPPLLQGVLQESHQVSVLVTVADHHVHCSRVYNCEFNFHSKEFGYLERGGPMVPQLIVSYTFEEAYRFLPANSSNDSSNDKK